MKKILFANYRFFPGAGDVTYLWNLEELLKSKGYSVSFFSMNHPMNRFDQNNDLFMEYIDFRSLNENKNIHNAFKVLSRVFYSKEARQKFSKLLDRIQPDIIHLHNIHHHISPSIIFEGEKRKIPIVWTLHDFKLICPNTSFVIDKTNEICELCRDGRYYHATIKKCKKNSLLASTTAAIEGYIHQSMKISQKIDLFISPSQFLREKFIDYGFNPNKIAHLPLFPFLEEPINNERHYGDYFLFMGRINPRKGYQILNKACKINNNIKVIFSGFPEAPWVEELTSSLAANARYVGLKNSQELSELIKNARAIIVPSICYENQPFAVLEAFYFGKPVIASNLGGLVELVKHKERGLLFRTGDADELAHAMHWMMENINAVCEMGENAAKYVIENHTPESHFKQLNTIYNELMNNN